ncbi:hypothetical protein H4R35_001297, partial [Dimargaris xerosporica]
TPLLTLRTSIMENTRDELHRKRQRLAELKRLNQERRQAFLGNRSTSRATSPEAPAGRDRQNIDDLVASLVGERAGGPTSPVRSRTSSISQTLSEPGIDARLRTSHLGAVTSPVFQSPGEQPDTTSPLSATATTAVPIPVFTAFDAVILDLPPKEKLFYNKEAQTTEMVDEVAMMPEEEIERRVREQRDKDEKARLLAEEQEKKRLEELQKQREQLRELTEEEKDSIEQSADFIEFVNASSKLIERALDETYDFMTDYTISQHADGADAADGHLKLLHRFYDERLAKNRSVTDVAWSKRFPELLVSAYNRNPLAMNEPDGIVCVWNLHLHDRPEFVFYSQSDVLRATFSDFHPNLVIGGSYSGQILLWDTRAKSLPVLKTPLSAVGHTHPVYALNLVGTQNAHHLVSASTDGMVCTWQLDMLAKPQDVLELVHATHPRTDEVAPTTMGFPDGGETAAVWLGTEEGNVYQANRYDRAGSKAGLNPADTYRGHTGPVTGLHFHPLFGPTDYTDLFLTCSVDWTVKLWRAKSPSKPSISHHHQPYLTPLYSFEAADDYVYDVKWSPVHPAMFGTVDGSGRLDLWNLNAETEVPVLSTTVGTGKALNRLAWDKPGRKAAVGSIDSCVYVYDIGDKVVPTNQDFTAFQRTIADLALTQPMEVSDNNGY